MVIAHFKEYSESASRHGIAETGQGGARATRIGNLRKWCKEKPVGERHDGAGKTYQVKF